MAYLTKFDATKSNFYLQKNQEICISWFFFLKI